MTPEELNRINAEHYAKQQKTFAEQCEKHPERLVVAARRATKLVQMGLCGDADFLEDTSIEAVMGAESRRESSYQSRHQANVASKPRKKKEKTTLSGEFIERMTSERDDERSLTEFIDLALADKIEGVGLKKHPAVPLAYLATAYAVPVESDDEAKGWKKKSHETLKEWWKKAGRII
ncbi:hypothetical protein ASE98_23405 [Pseudomonas sp. Leaf48]|uniref:hypothetical protein n=1 Tax=Pseudomonas sp. Leaf48 TaxID=1736221 RepID=UPI000725BFD6|nr:hypothetical protein [Pseudomonas sp. Leaf48]KQN50472.1 hypothetical protein ASE98_23405 [Pseudomonas sp. Leaf48]